ncbi:MAG: hypothetical protein JSV78_11220 [Phycisphaerales bacterium]|jgi:hypothetical protein|nr:MAG: hypothetical protein JSV78_11220 [Phycisphaerales bacterium]
MAEKVEDYWQDIVDAFAWTCESDKPAWVLDAGTAVERTRAYLRDLLPVLPNVEDAREHLQGYALQRLVSGMLDVLGTAAAAIENKSALATHWESLEANVKDLQRRVKLLELRDSVVQEHFGACPVCGKTDGYLNIGREHWFYCKAHKTRWHVGSNLFPSWRRQTEERWKRNSEFLADFQEVKPLGPGDPMPSTRSEG